MPKRQPEFFVIDILVAIDKIKRRVAGFYFGVDLDLIFNDIAKKKVPLLEQDILEFVKQKKEKTYFLEAVKGAKADLAEFNRHESVAYLERLERLIVEF